MTRKSFLAGGAAAVAVALALTACSSGGGSRDDESGPVTLDVAVWSYDLTPEFKALFDAFHAANPDITIKPVDILAADYETKIATMLAGGDKTDVIAVKTVADYTGYTGKGQLADVTDLVDHVKTQGTPAGLDNYDQNGRFFAVPYRQDHWVLYYNKKIFADAGVAVPENLTWDQYAALAKQLTTTKDGKAQYGTYHHVWRSVVQAISSAQNGGDLLSADYGFMKNQYDLALDLQKSKATLDYSTAKSQKVTYQTMFETGQAAMLPMGTWFISALLADKAAGKTDVDWAIAPMPQVSAGTPVTTFGAPTAFAVNKNAKHAAAAKKFLEFAGGADGANAIAKIGVVPALKTDAITQTYFGLDGMPADDTSKKAFAPDTIVPEMPASKDSAAVDTILSEEHDLIMAGQKSVEDGISEMQSRVKDEVQAG